MDKYRSRRLSVALCGEHGHRTPLSYAVYRDLAAEWIEIADHPADAEVLIFGFAKDIEVQSKSFFASARKNSAKYVVLSEEPLWDTVWSTGSNLVKNRLESNGVEYFKLNNFTADIFYFEKCPHFITTDDHYFVRYRSMLMRNSSFSASDLLDIWRTALTSYAFVAEKLVGEEYDIRTDGGAIGLSHFRTALAEAMRGPRTLIRGAGWGAGPNGSLYPTGILKNWPTLIERPACCRQSKTRTGLLISQRRSLITMQPAPFLSCTFRPVAPVGSGRLPSTSMA